MSHPIALYYEELEKQTKKEISKKEQNQEIANLLFKHQEKDDLRAIESHEKKEVEDLYITFSYSKNGLAIERVLINYSEVLK